MSHWSDRTLIERLTEWVDPSRGHDISPDRADDVREAIAELERLESGRAMAMARMEHTTTLYAETAIERDDSQAAARRYRKAIEDHRAVHRGPHNVYPRDVALWAVLEDGAP